MAGEDSAYLDFVRRLECCACLGPGPCQAHHNDSARDARGRRRGKGQRAHDHDAMPLHMGCHGEFTERRGFCDGWTNKKREAWQRDMAAQTWALWVATPAGKDAERYAVQPMLGPDAFYAELREFRRRLPLIYGIELEAILERHRPEF